MKLSFYISLLATLAFLWPAAECSQRHEFSRDEALSLTLRPTKNEKYTVELPCSPEVWFKIFLNGANEQNMHIELYGTTRGNIYCNKAGAMDWWGGQKTDFSLPGEGLQCQDSKITVGIHKTSKHIAILSGTGDILYLQRFSSTDGNCKLRSNKLQTQVWDYSGNLYLKVGSRAPPRPTPPKRRQPILPLPPGPKMKMYEFSQDAPLTLGIVPHGDEKYEVHLPCSMKVWFKLFLNGAEDQNMHIELFDRYRGNIYCNEAGARDWYGGERTDFRLLAGGLRCEEDRSKIIVHVHKTKGHVAISNAGRKLYVQEFSTEDGNCRLPSLELKTQVWNYVGSLSLGIIPNNDPTGTKMYGFSKGSPVKLGILPSKNEKYEVHLPCSRNIWFKLFLKGANEANMHIELFDKRRGNIYCNRGGSQNWYGGERTDFTMISGGLRCEDDRSKVIVNIEKSQDHVAILNAGRVLYEQNFGFSDGNCKLLSHELRTQVWHYTGGLSVGIVSNQIPEPTEISEVVTSEVVTSEVVTSEVVTSEAVTSDSEPDTSKPVTSEPVTSELMTDVIVSCGELFHRTKTSEATTQITTTTPEETTEEAEETTTETPITQEAVVCSTQEFTCPQDSVSGVICIPMSWVCDSKPHCPNGADEKECNPSPVGIN